MDAATFTSPSRSTRRLETWWRARRNDERQEAVLVRNQGDTRSGCRARCIGFALPSACGWGRRSARHPGWGLGRARAGVPALLRTAVVALRARACGDGSVLGGNPPLQADPALVASEPVAAASGVRAAGSRGGAGAHFRAASCAGAVLQGFATLRAAIVELGLRGRLTGRFSGRQGWPSATPAAAELRGR